MKKPAQAAGMKKAGAGPAQGMCYSFWMDYLDHQMFERGMIALAIVIAWNFVLGLIEGARSRNHGRWQEVWREPLKQRILRRLRGQRGVTTVETPVDRKLG